MKKVKNDKLKRKFRLGKTEKEILKAIGIGVLVGASIVAPGISVLLKPFINNPNKKKTYKQSIKKLYEKNLIILSGEKIYLSKRGQELMKTIYVEDIVIKKNDWDGIWRIVSYDIPDEKKKERDYFRRKLKELGFSDLQKSMKVIPYECKEEIAVFAQSIGVSPYVMFLTTDHLPRQNELIKKFNLS